VLTLTERSLLIETGAESDEVLTGVDPVVVENQAFLEAVRSGDPSTVLCSYADALETHRLAHAVRAAL
jgi:hypothetical protein